MCYSVDTQEWYDQWTAVDSDKARFNRDIALKSANFQKFKMKLPVYTSCDLLAMATVVDGSVAMTTEDVYATVELNGQHTRGQMVVDWGHMMDQGANITIVTSVDVAKAKELFDSMVN
jgi:purine nucleosidase